MEIARAAALVLVAGCSRPQPPAPTTTTTTTSASASPSVSAPSPAMEFSETDFQGAFNGAKLVATLEAKSAAVSGTCFYEGVGIDIPLSGTIAADGAITLNERKGTTPISTITLARAPDGTLSGTWKTAEKSGPATLVPVAYAKGDKLAVVTRHADEKSIALCGTFADEKPKAPCRRKAKAPVVLGLNDRAFEKKLNAALAERATMSPPPNPEGIGVSVDYTLHLAARGILSVVFVGTYECASSKDCGIDGYVPGHKWNQTTSLTAAVDAGVIAKSYSDFVDFSKAVPLVKPLVVDGFKACVTSGPERPLDGIADAVLTETGVSFEHDRCTNHVHSDAWDPIPYAKLGAALHAGSPFESAWKK